jgi:hypothetical protein|tara:strand:- start:1571 stop:2266 length:696 start_codon:yes stop_codon:yes gene_type:complete
MEYNIIRNCLYNFISGSVKFFLSNFYDVEAEGLENIINDSEGGIIISNHDTPQEDWIYRKDKNGKLVPHTHSVDQLLISSYMARKQKFHAVVSKRHYENPLRGKLLEALQQIPATNKGLIEKSKKYLDRNEYILIFPEGNSGQRSKIEIDGSRKIYPGLGRLVTELNNPKIFPVKVKINGKRDTLWPRFSNANIKFGEPFHYLDKFDNLFECGLDYVEISKLIMKEKVYKL